MYRHPVVSTEVSFEAQCVGPRGPWQWPGPQM